MPTKVLSIDLIQVLGTVQPRATLNEDAIADYAEHYAPDSKLPLPPLRVFHDGERYVLSRGFHRYTAATRAKRASLECEVMDGDERAAILDAMLDNDTHGVRLTPADKRKAVNRLLDDKNWSKEPQVKIAAMANVSITLVRAIVAERKTNTPTQDGMLEKASNPAGGKITRRNGTSQPATKPGVKGGIAAAAKRAEAEPVKPKPKATGGAGIVALDGEEAEAFDARQQVKCWADTVGRWLSQLPSIDGYRKKYPGKEGDRVVKAATELYEALKKWEKVIK